MGQTLKRNVEEFNRDVEDNGGYRYTLNATYSSIVSNRRITDKTEEVFREIGGISSVIDIGCGDGSYTGELKQRLPSIRFTGFDPAAAAINAAREKYPSCSFHVGDILRAGTLPKGTYDIAILRGVIHHLPTQSLAIRNAALLSKRVLIVEPNGNNPILKWIEKKSHYHIKHEEQSFSSQFLRTVCIENGLKVRQLSYIGFVPFFFPELPARVIHFLQPLLEGIPLLGRCLGAQTVLLAEKPTVRGRLTLS